MNAWVWLMIAILFEVAGTTALKVSAGLSKVVPSLLVLFFYIISFSSLAFSLKTFEVGLAYAIWSGLGTALIAIIGIYYFGESISWMKICSIALIIAGVVGLNLSGGVH